MNDTKCFEIFKVQFLSCLNVNLIKFENLKNITWDQQEELLNNTVDNALNKKFPLKNSYQTKFLKYLIQYFETNNIEINDRIYEAYCNLKCKPVEDDKLAYKHYFIIKYETCISLNESKSFVAEGTTGLCSWQASLALSNWIMNNPIIVNDKIVLELGAGTALSSLTVIKCCNPKEVFITDGSIKVIDLLNQNLRNNFASVEESSNDNISKYTCKNQSDFSTFILPWEDIESLNLENIILPDVILAADIVYDNSLFIPLSKTINYIFSYMKNKCVMYLAATVRNHETLNEFLKILEDKNFNLEKMENKYDINYFYWDDTIPIYIYRISKIPIIKFI